jgi:endonuclease/exonuclease/phosphatase (EEP) superfamily protein YafD
MIGLVTVALASSTALPSLREHLWFAELPSHFPAQIALVAGLTAMLSLTRRMPSMLLINVLVLIIHGHALLKIPQAKEIDARGLVIVSQNLQAANADSDAALRVLTAASPDILVLQEYTPGWHEALEPLRESYEFDVAVPEPGAFGIALYSRIPLTNQTVSRLGRLERPVISTRIESDTYRGQLLAVHLEPPMTAEWSQDHRRQIRELEDLLGKVAGPFVVAGDFNDTPASPTMRRLLERRQAHLAPPSWLPSWPMTLGIFGIPIDLIIGSEDVAFTRRTLLSGLGSDHRGIQVSIATLQNP